MKKKKVLGASALAVCGVLSRVQLFATPRTTACPAPLSMEFPRQEDWSGFPFPPPGDLPEARIEHMSPALGGGFFATEPPGKLVYKIPS